LDAPAHSGDAVFYCVDGFAGDRSFGEAAQVDGRGFGERVGARPVSVEDRGQREGAAFGDGGLWRRACDAAQRAADTV